jgi:hypothetical protein
MTNICNTPTMSMQLLCTVGLYTYSSNWNAYQFASSACTYAAHSMLDVRYGCRHMSATVPVCAGPQRLPYWVLPACWPLCQFFTAMWCSQCRALCGARWPKRVLGKKARAAHTSDDGNDAASVPQCDPEVLHVAGEWAVAAHVHVTQCCVLLQCSSRCKAAISALKCLAASCSMTAGATAVIADTYAPPA